MTTNAAPTGRILNVDDNAAGRYVKTRVLTLAGFEVIEAENGAEALAKAAAERPELVLLDVKLPDISGLEVCRRLKSAAETRAILVLQTSASMVDSAHRIKALDGGADSYLVEPIEADELVANVRALLRLSRAEQARREAEHARDESEARFRQLAESITDVFWVVDAPVTHFLYVSPAYDKHWQGQAEQLYSRPSAWFTHVHADDRQRMQQRFAQLMQTEGYQDEYRVVDAAGEERWVTERVFPIRDASGKPTRFAGITQDNTLRKRAELMLIGADRRKDEFLAMLSHELRSPLAPIRSAVDVLSRTRVDADSKANALRIIGRQVEHLARLVDDLLDVARINQGKISLNVGPLQLQAVLNAAIETTRPLMQIKGHELDVELPDAPVWVSGDEVRLTQVFGNLLNNAAKFTPAEGRIEVRVRRGARRVEVSITDNGAGMSADVIPHVFDLFAQAEQALDRSQGGLGVGLSLVKRMLTMHGGDVHAESEGPGKGSRFTVTLPQIEAPEHEAGAPATKPRAGALRILAVDDNADALEAMAMLLESAGHAVHMATHADSALRLAADVTPDVVLLDIGLPGMNGYELAAALRAMKLPNPPVLIAVSGYGREGDRARARDAGFAHHLVKPADPARLFAILGEVGKASAATSRAPTHTG
jgi:PAS domain S-box-containing protein